MQYDRFKANWALKVDIFGYRTLLRNQLALDYCLAPSVTRRWSVGGSQSNDLWYLGGPLSFLNGACQQHANAHYDFMAKPMTCVIYREIEAGNEVLICYSGSDVGKPLKDTYHFVRCSVNGCSSVIMEP